jgi:exopolysaccharide biosynthesis polyprenyl glycosylphosphotransferase
MFSRQHRRARILFGITDIVLITLAFEFAYWTRLWLPLENVFFIQPAARSLVLAGALTIWIVCGAGLRVYERLDSGDPRVILRDSFRQTLYTFIGFVLVEYLLRLDLSRLFLGVFAIYVWTLIFLFRLTAGRLMGVVAREFGQPRNILVVGTGERAGRIAKSLEHSTRYGVHLMGFLEMGSVSGRQPLPGAYPVYGLAELPALLSRHVVDEIIIAVESENLQELEEVFLLCDEEGVKTRVAVDFFPHVNSEIYLERLGFTPLLTFSATPHDEIRLSVKRLADIVLSAAGLIVLAPLMLALVVLIRLTSAGPAIFRQQRCGLNGRRFTFYKFRSMCQDAEDRKSGLMHLNRRTPAFKLPRDPRLTPLGRYLRKFSIDEWPQLWNVLKGDMSLVGPRPAVPEEVEQYRRWQRRRMRMRPGLTCLWAIAGRDTLDFESWMRMDMQYIDNWSLTLDCKILLQTIPRVLTGKGAN